MSYFLDDATITDLGFGSGFALWGFRAIALDCRKGCQLSVGFNKAFAMENAERHSQHGGTGGRLAMNALKSFSYQLRQAGQRTITLSRRGFMEITRDEISIIAALAGAQTEDNALCRTHLSGLIGNTNIDLTYRAAQTYGMICSRNGIELKPPRDEILAKFCPMSREEPVPTQRTILEFRRQRVALETAPTIRHS